MPAGLWFAPLLALILYFLPFPLSAEGHRMLAVLGMASTLWITEALPLPATALLVAVLTIILGIAPAGEVFAVYADPIIFLFIGSFIIAEAMQHHGLDRRLAHGILRVRWVRARAGRMTLVFAAIGFLLSFWVSNTATTAMMYPIALSIIRIFHPSERPAAAKFILLLTSFATSIGGMGTPVGTPPNLIGLGFLRNLAHENLSFFNWMKFAVPIGVVIFLAIYLLMRFLLTPEMLTQEMQELPDEEFDSQTRRAQRNVALVFALTVVLWLLPGFIAIIGGDGGWWEKRLPESVVALIGALLLFLFPVDWRSRKFTITWKQAQNINWGIILLFGGGLVIGKFLFKTGVAEFLGNSISAAFPFHSQFMYIVLFTILAIFISEFTSNTASANLILPICIAVCQGAGIDPFKPALAATLASSLGFMLPISTGPNAIVFGSGMIPIQSMMRYGILLDIVGAALVAIGVHFLM